MIAKQPIPVPGPSIIGLEEALHPLEQSPEVSSPISIIQSTNTSTGMSARRVSNTKPSYYLGYRPRVRNSESSMRFRSETVGDHIPARTGPPMILSPNDIGNSASTLDDTGRYVKGKGILASKRDMKLPPEEFAEGCKLLQAAALGDEVRVSALLRNYPKYINFRDYDRRTALHVAASEGHLKVVKKLVESYGAQINRSDRWGGSPLDDAHRHRHVDVVQYLRSRGATTGSADQGSNLIKAAAEGDLDEVQMLLSSVAIMGKNNEVVGFANSVNVDKCDYDGRTALHLAAMEGHAQVVEFLCSHGANVNVKDQWGGRPLDDAIRKNSSECIEILKKYDAIKGTSSHLLEPSNLEDGAGKQTSYEDENLRTDFTELEVIDKIGAGAFGEIYKCRWRGTLVAAKCIKSTKIVREWQKHNENNKENSVEKITEDEMSDALADFRQETAILRTLRHPNICMLLAYSQTENFEVMISELMKCSLLDIFNANALHNTSLGRKKQIAFAQQLSKGMNYLHNCKPPIIHRDLKPANLLIDFSGTLKITDFGLAKVRPDPKAQETGTFRMTGETGSYRFMAPEVFRHEEYTETVDIYSFAMIFYYMMSGRPPWASLSGLKAVYKASIDAERPFVDRSWDGQLSNLMMQCWDENPNARPPFSKILKELSDYSQSVFKMDADSVAMAQDSGCRCVIS